MATRAGGLTVPSISIVLSTYEWPDALDAVLRGFADQSDENFELAVADDGSGPRTAAVVDSWSARLGSRLAYVRQEDLGFRLARLRNLGAVTARGDYLVFVDGDCIPRPGFVASIRRAALQGWFLATKRVELGSALSQAAIDGRVPVGRRSVASFMLSSSRTPGWIDLTPRDRRRPWRPGQPDFWPDGNAYGCMMAMYRTDFEAVNGFDMRYVEWGEEDADLAVRLGRLGLRCGWAGPQSTLLHLAHASNMPRARPSWWLLQETLRQERIRAMTGVDELRTELARDVTARRALAGR